MFAECRKVKGGLWETGKDRDTETLDKDYTDWKIETDSDKDLVKNYHNSENEHLLRGKYKSKRIKDILIIPGLHTIILGPVNKVYDEICKKVDLTDFENEINITRDDYHGKKFEGKECRKIFKKVEILKKKLVSVNTEWKDFTDCLRKLSVVDKVANDSTLAPDYKEKIKAFEDSWMVLHDKYKVTIPNKVHIIVTHLVEYFDERGITLNQTSDQTIESMHHELFRRLREQIIY